VAGGIASPSIQDSGCLIELAAMAATRANQRWSMDFVHDQTAFTAFRATEPAS
jgi:hypothetical protein